MTLQRSKIFAAGTAVAASPCSLRASCAGLVETSPPSLLLFVFQLSLSRLSALPTVCYLRRMNFGLGGPLGNGAEYHILV